MLQIVDMIPQMIRLVNLRRFERVVGIRERDWPLLVKTKRQTTFLAGAT